MQADNKQRLDDIMWRISDLRGLDSVCIIHSLLMESIRYCDEKLQLNLLNDIERYGISSDRDLSQKGYLYRFLHHKVYMNVFRGEDPPDAPQNYQEEAPLDIDESLERLGDLSADERYEIFRNALERVHLNPLWPDYELNPFVKAAKLTGKTMNEPKR